MTTQAGQQNNRNHALVIGASMAGLVAARALTDHFSRVTILDRDSLPDADDARKAVPQGRHPHGLLAAGRNQLEAFFPGLTEEIVQSGGLCGDLNNDTLWVGHNVTLASDKSGLVGLLAPRPAIEGHIRRRLIANPRVQVLDRRSVQHLLTDAAQSAVTGVRIKHDDGREEDLSADLVIDAGGRGAGSRNWLPEIGYAAPAEEEVKINISYTTRSYRRHEGDIDGRFAVVIAGSAPSWRNAAMLAQSADRWIIALGGYFGDHAETDHDAFCAYAKTLPSPHIHSIVARNEPLTDFATYRFPASLRRYYNRLERFPKNFLVFGDALCSFNPVFGQGMTVATLEAKLLGECLQRSDDNLARRFFNGAAAIIDVPWQIAVGNDLRHPDVAAKRPLMTRFINWYVGKLHLAAVHDPLLAGRFIEVANMMAPPPALLAPSTMFRVIRGNLGRSASRDQSPVQNLVPSPDLSSPQA